TYRAGVRLVVYQRLLLVFHPLRTHPAAVTPRLRQHGPQQQDVSAPLAGDGRVDPRGGQIVGPFPSRALRWDCVVEQIRTSSLVTSVRMASLTRSRSRKLET
ncbi:unnamed protein product, partial [Amoebophrya sp. A25]